MLIQIQSKDQKVNVMLLMFLLDSYRNNKGTCPVTRLSSMTFSRFSKSCLGVAFFARDAGQSVHHQILGD